MIRLGVYELRKLFDTRSSVLLFGVCALCGAGLSVLGMIVSHADGGLDLSQVGAAAVLPFAVIAPIVGAVAAGSDWGLNAIEQTLIIEGRRRPVIAAKFAAALISCGIVCLTAIIIAVASGVAVAAFRGQEVSAGFSGSFFWELSIIVVPGTCFGFGMGLLFLSTPLAVVTVLVVELVVDVALSALPAGLGPYFQSASLTTGLSDGGAPFSALSAFVLWIVVPFSVGCWRFLRKEVAA